MNLNSIHGINLDESTYHPVCFRWQLANSHYRFRTGNIVYAQYKSFCWWPGRIATPAEVNRNIQNSGIHGDTISDSKYFVYFFASYTYAWLDEKKLVKFEGGLTRKQKKFKSSQRNSKNYKLALKEAAEYVNGERVMIATSLLWVQSWPSINDAGQKGKKERKKRAGDRIDRKVSNSVNKDKKQKVEKAHVVHDNVNREIPKDDALCFVCLTGGSLICCDVPSCPRVYHYSCLRLRRPPPDDAPFICPWHSCSACGARDNEFPESDTLGTVSSIDSGDNTTLLNRPRRYAYNPYARFDQTENYRGNVKSTNFVSNIVVQSDEENETGGMQKPSVKSVNELGGIQTNKKIHFWYSTLSPCSFCPKCINTQKQCKLLHITEIGEKLFKKQAQFFVPDYLQKSRALTRLNLIFERVLFFVAGNSLAQPFLQPLLLSLPRQERDQFLKLLGPEKASNSHLSYIAEKVRQCMYHSLEDFMNDWRLVQDSCETLTNGKYAKSASSLLEACRSILCICTDQLKAHIKDIKVLEQSIKDTKIRSNNGEILAECQNVTLRSKVCFPELSPANDVSVPRFENGWTLSAWSRLVEAGKKYDGLPLTPISVDPVTDLAGNTDMRRTSDYLKSDEEVNVANVLSSISDSNPVTGPEIFAQAQSLDSEAVGISNETAKKNASGLLPDPVEKIRLLVQAQNHHLRSALLASKELESSWFATQQMFCSDPSANGATLNGGDAIVSIGDGNLIAEYRLANRNLKLVIDRLRQELRNETILRKTLEEKLARLDAAFSTQVEHP